MLDVVGRKFVFEDSTVLVVARDEAESNLVSTMAHPGNVFLKTFDVPGPLCIMRGRCTSENLKLAAGICLRYGKARGSAGHVAAYGEDSCNLDRTVESPVFSVEYCRTFQD